MDAQKDFFSVYFAGELFTHKDLVGNAMLAEAIYARSGGGFRCALPQNFEQRKSQPKGIRDEDILSLLECDLALFNYDGQELDSGTVVEFMFAKFADIPALVVRSDFRGGGDCSSDPQPLPWNLMASFYPRTAAGRLPEKPKPPRREGAPPSRRQNAVFTRKSKDRFILAFSVVAGAGLEPATFGL